MWLERMIVWSIQSLNRVIGRFLFCLVSKSEVEFGAALHERGPDLWLLVRSEHLIPLGAFGGFLPCALPNPKRVSI